ncbi:MAG: methyltransferase domain-containing protein [Deltaproteobacteria bacterium]|nr:methyltransferase domain-containing protein [Deltaproteobacteria bacterium]MBW1873067.1 methyltransferase domain-containing protein [Deltaproteobacteria bacterium]
MADSSRPGSLASSLRKKRFAFFTELLNRLKRPIKILDLGGTQSFWEQVHLELLDQVEIHLLNLKPVRVSRPNFQSLSGDARRLDLIDDQTFDVVFSNSVIEHVGTLADQRCMASEIRRVAKRYFVQTPNKYFPIEPHFLFPFFQFLPLEMKIFLITHFDLGWSGKMPNRKRALRQANSVRLLSRADLESLFPEAEIKAEKFLGLTKSFMIMSGW